MIKNLTLTRAGANFNLMQEDDGTFIVSHQDLLQEVEARRLNVAYKTDIIPLRRPEGDTLECVVTCTISDGGHSVEAVGESNDKINTSAVEQAYPATTAANRAFDRAAIRFFGFYEARVYSNLEKPFKRPSVTPNQGTQNGNPEEQTLLFGNLKGSKICNVIQTAEFAKFLEYIQSHPDLVYAEPEKNQQLAYLRTLTAEGGETG